MGQKADFDDSSRMILMQFLLGHQNSKGKTKRGLIKQAAEWFQVSRKSIWRIWKSGKQQEQTGECIEEVTALRNNIKRKRGTKEIKPIQSITRQVIKECIIKEVVPQIKQKWPDCLTKNICIQQDNARPDISNADTDFQECANADGFHIKLVQQPANSPDCNVNDLGFFSAIQALQHSGAGIPDLNM